MGLEVDPDAPYKELCLLLRIKSPGIPQLVTKLYNKWVNGQKSGFSGVGAVLGRAALSTTRDIASVGNCRSRSSEIASRRFNLEKRKMKT